MARSKNGVEESAIGRRREAARLEPSRGYAARKQALLGAAAKVFQEKGFQAVRMDDVARQLRVDRATLYYYFGNKEQLFRDVILEAVTVNAHVAEQIADGEGRGADKLAALLTSLIAAYDRLYPLAFVFVQEDLRRIAGDGSAESRQLVKLGDAFQSAVERIIRQGISEGDFAPDADPSLTTHAIVGAANWAHRWFTPTGGGATGAEVGARFAEIFLNGLLVGTARRRRAAPVAPVVVSMPEAPAVAATPSPTPAVRARRARARVARVTRARVVSASRARVARARVARARVAGARVSRARAGAARARARVARAGAGAGAGAGAARARARVARAGAARARVAGAGAGAGAGAARASARAARARAARARAATRTVARASAARPRAARARRSVARAAVPRAGARASRASARRAAPRARAASARPASARPASARPASARPASARPASASAPATRRARAARNARAGRRS
ncbi:MAG TPA: TetR/AcrR family transcriptional regulator [Conexibacter sp.]